MGAVDTPKSKMAASSVSSGGNSKNTVLRARSKVKQITRAVLDDPATSEHMSALLAFKFVTTTPTKHVRAVKTLFDVIIRRPYSSAVPFFYAGYGGH